MIKIVNESPTMVKPDKEFYCPHCNDDCLLGAVPGLIAQNNIGELDAIKGYEDLISCLEDTYPEYIPDIEEIIADEKNHVEVLNKILKELDGILPNKD